MTIRCSRPVAALLALALGSSLTAQAPVDPKPAAKPAPSKAPASSAKAKTSTVEPRTKGKLKPVDINHAHPNEIAFMLGIDAALAAKVVANRPYKTKADLVVKKVFTQELFEKLRKQVIAG